MPKTFDLEPEIEVTTKGAVVKADEKVKIPFREGEAEIEPPGSNEPKKITIYLYDRDVKLIKDYKRELKKSFGKVSTSEIFRFALNYVNIKRFKTGY